MNKIEIIKLNHSHIVQIQKIWEESLPYNLKSMIGDNIISTYMSFFFNSNKTLGVGLSLDNQLKGFVLFGKDKNITKQLIKNNYFKIIKNFLKCFIKFNFKKILNYLNCTIYLILSTKKEEKLFMSDTELLIICVSKSEQGKKYGSLLINKSIDNFQGYFKNYKGIFVKTLKKDQQNILFYQINNFQHFLDIFGRSYLRFNYEKKI